MFWISIWSFLLTKPLILLSGFLMKYRTKKVKDEHERKRKYDLPRTIADIESSQIIVIKTRTRCEVICFWTGVSLLLF